MAAALRQVAPSAGRPSAPERVADEGMMSTLIRMAETVGTAPTRLMRDFAGLSFGPGRVAFSDYVRLRLYDEVFWGETDRRWVAGARRARDIALLANFRREWFALAQNRLAANAFLAAHGLPVPPILAIFCAELAAPSSTLLRTRDELRRFLAEHCAEPIVGAPAEGGTSRLIRPSDPIEMAVAIDHLIEDVVDNHPGGFLFQPQITPDEETARLTGGALAPVRFITQMAEGCPRILNAVWRLPVRSDVLAGLDTRCGAATNLAVFRGDEFRLVRRESVFGRGVAQAPGFALMKATAVEAARLMRAFGLLAWDVALTADGPMILGVDPLPDLGPCQIVHRRGVLDSAFQAFLEERRVLAAEEADAARGMSAWSP